MFPIAGTLQVKDRAALPESGRVVRHQDTGLGRAKRTASTYCEFLRAGNYSEGYA